MKRPIRFLDVVAISLIIALVSAISVPAFAQLGNKKLATYMGNMGRVGSAAHLYLADNNDSWALSMGTRGAAQQYRWRVGVTHPVPSDILDPETPSGSTWASPENQTSANSIWANSFKKYFRTYEVYENPVAQVSQQPEDVFVPNRSVPLPGIQMNGLLHNIDYSSINNPEFVPAFWHVQKVIWRGRCFSTPSLNCGGSPFGPTPCRFNPIGPPGPPGSAEPGYDSYFFVYEFTTTTWQFGQNMVIANADGSVRIVKNGLRIEPDFTPREESHLDPWGSVTATGVPVSFWRGGPGCVHLPMTNGYPCYFRPDRSK